MRTKYRYILNGSVKPDSPICNYRLIGASNIGNRIECIRVRILDDIKLNKYDCDPYSTTNDTRTIEELGYDIMIKFNNHWKVRNDLKPYMAHEFSDHLKGFCPTPIGYLTKDQYTEWRQKLDERISESWETAKKLKQQLDNRECFAEDVMYHDEDIIKHVLELYIMEKQMKRL